MVSRSYRGYLAKTPAARGGQHACVPLGSCTDMLALAEALPSTGISLVVIGA